MDEKILTQRITRAKRLQRFFNSAKICNIKNLWYDIGISKEESLPIHKTDSPS